MNWTWPVTGWRRRRLEEREPAVGAGRVGSEPLVYAPDMEPMVALGQHPDLLPVHELSQADGALRRRQGPLRLPVHSHRYPPKRVLLKPRRGQPGPSLVRRLGAEPPPAPQRAPHDRVEPQRTDQGAQQGRQDYDHVVVEARLAGVGFAVRPIRGAQGRVDRPGSGIQ